MAILFTQKINMGQKIFLRLNPVSKVFFFFDNTKNINFSNENMERKKIRVSIKKGMTSEKKKFHGNFVDNESYSPFFFRPRGLTHILPFCFCFLVACPIVVFLGDIEYIADTYYDSPVTAKCSTKCTMHCLCSLSLGFLRFLF